MISLGGAFGWFGRQPYLLLAVTALSWAGNVIAGRLGVGEASPMAIVTLRWLVVLSLLLAVAGGETRREWAELRRRSLYLFCMGAGGYTAFNAIFYWAAHHTSAVNMGVLQGVTPAMVMIGAFAAYRTPITGLQLAGLAATALGVVVATCRGDLEVLRSFAFNVGDLGIVLASVLYAGYTVALRRRPAVGPLTFFSAMAASAFLSSLPLLAAEAALGALQWPTPTGWALILYISLMPSLLAQLCYMRAVELIGPSRAGLFMNLVPVIAAGLGVLILRESFAAYHAVSLACVLGGLWLAEKGAARRAAAGGTG